MIWDTGHSMTAPNVAPKVSLVDLLAKINYDRAQTVASIERLKKLVASQKATLIIQHDARDIGKLPVFPAMAK